MDLTSYGRLVAAFDELKLKAEDELKWEQCAPLAQRPELAQAMQTIQARFFGADAAPTLKDVLQGMLSPDASAEPTAEPPAEVMVKRTGSLKKQRTNELDDADSTALVVRTAAGSVVITWSKQDAIQTVAELRKQVAEQLSLCVDEVKFVAEERPLLDDESCAELIGGKTDALEVLMVTQQIPKLDPDQPVADQLDTLKAMLRSTSPEYQLDAATNYRKLLSIERDPPIGKILDSGVAPRLLELAQLMESPKLQFEALWAICNIVSGSQEQTQTMVNLDVVPIVTRILQESDNSDVLEQGVWALGNVAGDCAGHRDVCLREGSLEPILRILQQSDKLSCTRNAVWAVSNLCRGRPKPRLEELRPAVPVIAEKLRNSHDSEVLVDSLWCFSYISDGANHDIQVVLDTGISERLVELMNHESLQVVTPALRTAANLVTGDDMQTDFFLRSKPWDTMQRLLGSQKNKIRQECCWMISNICAGTTDQIDQVFESGLFSAMLHRARDTEYSVRKEVAFALANTSEKEEVILDKLMDQDILETIKVLMAATDDKILTLCLTFLENVSKALHKKDSPEEWERFKRVSFVDELEACMARGAEVAEKADEVMQELYPLEDETGPEVFGETAPKGGYGFAFGG